jgi:hypothetical protein
MDFCVKRNPAHLESTGYVEIGSGRYVGKHWQPGCVFVWEDAFGMAEGIILTHFPEYDHMSMNDIPKHAGLAIADEWCQAAASLSKMNAPEAASILNVGTVYGRSVEDELRRNHDAIARMLRELAAELRLFYQGSDWVHILGV